MYSWRMYTTEIVKIPASENDTWNDGVAKPQPLTCTEDGEIVTFTCKKFVSYYEEVEKTPTLVMTSKKWFSNSLHVVNPV